MKRRTLLASIAGLFGLLIGGKVAAKPETMFDDFVLVPVDRQTGDPPAVLVWNEKEKRYRSAAVNHALLEYYRNLAVNDPITRQRILSGEWNIS